MVHRAELPDNDMSAVRAVDSGSTQSFTAAGWAL